jgi:hypothetical protein
MYHDHPDQFYPGDWLTKEKFDEAHKLVLNFMTFQNVSVNHSPFARVINLKQKNEAFNRKMKGKVNGTR